MNKIVEESIKLADWSFQEFRNKDFDIDEVHPVEILESNGVALAEWSKSEDCGGRKYTTLLIRFNKMTKTSISLLEMDMAGKLIPRDPAVGNSDGYDEYVYTDEVGDDIYVCPFGLEYEGDTLGWLTLTLKVFRC